jgi:hypothetical protein
MCYVPAWPIFGNNAEFTPIANAAIGDSFYSDLACTSAFDGDGLWYTLGDNENAPYGSRIDFKISSLGVIMESVVCVAPTPTATATPTPTPSSSAVTAEDPDKLYFFHGGDGGHTYTPDLTSEGAVYYIDELGTSTTDLGVAMEALVTNSPTPYSPENATGLWPIVGEMDFSTNETITNSYRQWDYFVTGGGNYGGRELYYLAVPNNESFPEDLVANALVANLGNNQPVQMASQKDFTWNGDAYTLYKLPLATSNAAQTYKFLGTAPGV